MFSQDAPTKAGSEMMAMYFIFVALVIVALILAGVPLKGKGK
jgi:hypothetical protein